MIRPRVLIVDDQEKWRQMVSAIVATDYEVVGFADSGEKVAAAISVCHPEVVLLDVSMPGIGGLKVLPIIRRLFPELFIIMLSAYSEPLFISEAAGRGADGYVLKASALTELLPAMSHAMDNSREKPHARRQKGAG